MECLQDQRNIFIIVNAVVRAQNNEGLIVWLICNDIIAATNKIMALAIVVLVVIR